MKNIIISAVLAAIIFGGVGFYAGSKYGGGNSATRAGQFNVQAGAMGARGGRGGARPPNGQGFTAGGIVSVDSQSLTIKLQDGGSKIIFFTKETPVMKSVQGSNVDLKSGETITITGTANQDGSVTASSIQIRPTAGL